MSVDIFHYDKVLPLLLNDVVHLYDVCMDKACVLLGLVPQGGDLFLRCRDRMLQEALERDIPIQLLVRGLPDRREGPCAEDVMNHIASLIEFSALSEAQHLSLLNQMRAQRPRGARRKSKHHD